MDKNYRICNSGYEADQGLISHAEGNYLQDDQGNRYFDLNMGAGSLIFGHAPAFISEKIADFYQHGSVYVNNNDAVHQLSAKLLTFLPSPLNNFIFCNTGSESTQRAVRLARAATGKSTILSFHGGWHGMNEWTLMGDGGRFGPGNPINSRFGIPDSVFQHSIEADYRDTAVFELIAQKSAELAAIIIEPIQGSNPQPQIKDYLQALIEVCHKHQVLVIFDEIITGFRLSMGGAAEYFDLSPDIVTYGKVLGGGMPIGLVAFTESVYQQTFANKEKQILTGGTFSANPFVCKIANEVLTQLETPGLYQRLNSIGSRFKTIFNQELSAQNIPFYVENVGSIARMYFTDQAVFNRKQRDQLELSAQIQQLFYQSLKEQKILWPRNGVLCLSTTLTEEQIMWLADNVVDAATRILN